MDLTSLPPEPSRATEVALLALRSLPTDTPLDAVFRAACERSAEALDVERVGVWLFVDDKSALHCTNLYELSKGEHSSGAVLRVSDFPTYFAALTLRRAVPAENAASTPWSAELYDAYLAPLGITSILDAGLFQEGELIGVLCHEHVGPPREWTTEARDFVSAVANRLVLRMQEAKVRELQAAFLGDDERLANRDKMAALELFAAGVAHDFRNLLTVVVGTGELLRNRPDVPPEVRRYGQVLVDIAENGIGLIKQLAEFARPVVAPPAVVDVAELTSALLPSLSAAVGLQHSLSYTPPPPLGRVFIDRVQYGRLLMNLVLNARDAMDGGGAIRIHLTSVRISDDPAHNGRYVLVEIADTGPGMSEATKRKMFDPYFTTKAKGSGLGLAVVKQIVERVGGLIRVASAMGKGTVVRLYLPNVEMRSGGG